MMADMRIGAQLYTLRRFLQKPENVRGVFETVRDMGAQVVQVSGMCSMDPIELARISRDTELPICITHAPVDRIRDDLPRLAEEHLVFGCRNIGIGSMPKEYRRDLDGVKRFTEFLNATAERLADYAMTIAYHNHDFEFRRLDGRLMMDMLIEDTVPKVQFIPDTCWIAAGGYRSEDYLEKMSGRINTLHLKDYRRQLFWHIPKAIGDGTLDFSSILSAAVTHGVKNAVIELDYDRDPMRALRRSLGNIRELYPASRPEER